MDSTLVCESDQCGGSRHRAGELNDNEAVATHSCVKQDDSGGVPGRSSVV